MRQPAAVQAACALPHQPDITTPDAVAFGFGEILPVDSRAVNGEIAREMDCANHIVERHAGKEAVHAVDALGEVVDLKADSDAEARRIQFGLDSLRIRHVAAQLIDSHRP